MSSNAESTAFVTDADGFIGAEFVKVLVAAGHKVYGLARSIESAEQVSRAGAFPVIGDPLVPGRWQDEAASDWVFHVQELPLSGPRLTRTRAQAVARARVAVDAHVLDAVASGPTRRIVYLADSSCYGPTGLRPITEDDPIRPAQRGRCLTPALDRIDGYVIAGLPIVTALPGWVYGNGSWFRQQVIDPVMAGRRVLTFGRTGPWVSPIHVHDCARALVHLAERGDAGGRYFVVNNDPIRSNTFADRFARLSGRPLHQWQLPVAVAPVVLGRSLAAHMQADAVFSNIRLRGIGFRFRFPTIDQGIEDVVRSLS